MSLLPPDDEALLSEIFGPKAEGPAVPFRLMVIRQPDDEFVLQVFEDGRSVALVLTEIERATLVEALSRPGA